MLATSLIVHFTWSQIGLGRDVGLYKEKLVWITQMILPKQALSSLLRTQSKVRIKLSCYGVQPMAAWSTLARTPQVGQARARDRTSPMPIHSARRVHWH